MAVGLWHWLVSAGRIEAGTDAANRFAAFGQGTTIAFPPGTLFGEKYIAIGAHTIIGVSVTISAGLVPDLYLGEETLIRIGSGVVIGRDSHVIGHQSIDIGDDVFTGPNVYITDQNHAYQNPDVPIGKQWPVDAPVRIGSGCWIGANAVILPGTTIGRNVVVAAGSVVRGEFPDHCVLGGVPAKMIRRYDPETADWVRAEGVEAENAEREDRTDQAAQPKKASPASG
jgi:acetyltransferase-like isoleucine patch superfamily enzyme